MTYVFERLDPIKTKFTKYRWSTHSEAYDDKPPQSSI